MSKPLDECDIKNYVVGRNIPSTLENKKDSSC